MGLNTAPVTPAVPRLVSYRSPPNPVSHPRLYFCICRKTAKGCFRSSTASSGDPRGRDRRLVADRLAVMFAIRRFACSESVARRANLQFRDHIGRAVAESTVIARLRSENLVHHGWNAHRGALSGKTAGRLDVSHPPRNTARKKSS